MTISGIEADAIAWGFKKIGIHRSNGDALRWEIVCTGCGTSKSYAYKPNIPPQNMVKSLRQHNWRVTQGKPPLCGDCYSPKHTKEPVMTSPTYGPAPSPKLSVEIAHMLDEHFNKETHMYHTGWSDDDIAKKLNTSGAIVAYVRLTCDYGELAEDPFVTTLRAEIKTFDDLYTEALNKEGEKIQKARDEVTRLGEEHDALKNRHKKEITDLYAKLSSPRKGVKENTK